MMQLFLYTSGTAFENDEYLHRFQNWFRICQKILKDSNQNLIELFQVVFGQQHIKLYKRIIPAVYYQP
jgi:hypothetical protein